MYHQHMNLITVLSRDNFVSKERNLTLCFQATERMVVPVLKFYTETIRRYADVRNVIIID